MMVLSCDATDPALEEKVSKLEAENASLRQKLAGAEQNSNSSGAEVQQQLEAAQAEVQQAKQALLEFQSRFDRKRLEMSFAEAVSDFKQKTLEKYPDSVISSVTMHEMVLPSDHPFSSGLTMQLRNNETGQTRDTYWKALGNLDGQWNFKKAEPDQIASNRPDQDAPPLTRPEVTPPPNPAPPANPGGGIATGVRRLPSGSGATPGGGRVHVIDWGD